MIYIDYEAPGGITDVGFVYTSALGDDTPFQLEVPAHNPGDAIFVWARGGGGGLPRLPEGRNSGNVKVADFIELDYRLNSFVNPHNISWLIDVDGDVASVYFNASTFQMGIHVYRGVTGVGDTSFVHDVLDNFGADIPALTLQNSDGTSRVFCGVIFNQLKSGSSEPNTPAGLAKRLTSPSTLGGGTGVSYDTTDGVAAFPGARVDAFGGAYYVSWAIEMKV